MVSYYVPDSDQGKAEFLNNLALKIGGDATLLGVTSEEVDAVQDDAAMFSYILDSNLLDPLLTTSAD